MNKNLNRSGFLESISNGAPYLIIGITFLVVISALVSLVLSDVITGQVTGGHISQNPWFGLFVSLATTGMLIGCGAAVMRFWEKSNYLGLALIAIFFIGLQSADVYFDAVSVDIMRFGKIFSAPEMLDKSEALAHNIYRFLVAGVSLVGEPLAVASLVMFPYLKKFFYGILKENMSKFPQEPYNSPQKPKFTPKFPVARVFPPSLPRHEKNFPKSMPMPTFIPERYFDEDEVE